MSVTSAKDYLNWLNHYRQELGSVESVKERVESYLNAHDPALLDPELAKFHPLDSSNFIYNFAMHVAHVAKRIFYALYTLWDREVVIDLLSRHQFIVNYEEAQRRRLDTPVRVIQGRLLDHEEMGLGAPFSEASEVDEKEEEEEEEEIDLSRIKDPRIYLTQVRQAFQKNTFEGDHQIQTAMPLLQGALQCALPELVGENVARILFPQHLIEKIELQDQSFTITYKDTLIFEKNFKKVPVSGSIMQPKKLTVVLSKGAVEFSDNLAVSLTAFMLSPVLHVNSVKMINERLKVSLYCPSRTYYWAAKSLIEAVKAAASVANEKMPEGMISFDGWNLILQSPEGESVTPIDIGGGLEEIQEKVHEIWKIKPAFTGWFS